MKKVIGTKWVFTIERNEYGEIERYKARVVALTVRPKTIDAVTIV